MERRSIQIKNGETISYLKSGNGNKVLILLHGNLSSSLMFNEFIKEFDKDEYTIFAPDLRGFGNSTYYREISSINDLANDLNYFIDELNLSNITLLGSGIGGSIAMELTASNSVSLERLILVNSISNRGFPIFKKNEKNESILGKIYRSKNEMKNDPRDIMPMLSLLEDESSSKLDSYIKDKMLNGKNVSLEILNLMKKEAKKQKNLLEVFWVLANHNMSHKHNYYSIGTNNINNITIPVLHILSGKNKIVPDYMTMDNLQALKEYSKFIKYENEPHMIFIKPNKDFIKDIQKFIKKT